MANQQDVMKQAIGKIMAKAWMDADFKAQFLNDPRSVLAEVGLQPPAHIQIVIAENSLQQYYVPVPSPWMNTTDATFMQRLQQDPKTVLKEAGMQVPEQAVITFLENTANQTYIVLPMAPTYGECSIEKL